MNSFEKWYDERKKEIDIIEKYHSLTGYQDLYGKFGGYNLPSYLQYDFQKKEKETIVKRTNASMYLYAISDYAKELGLENTSFIDFETDTIKLDGMEIKRPESLPKMDRLVALSMVMQNGGLDSVKETISEVFGAHEFKVKVDGVDVFNLMESDIEKMELNRYDSYKNGFNLPSANTMKNEIEIIKKEVMNRLLYKKISKLPSESAVNYYKEALVTPLVEEKKKLAEEIEKLPAGEYNYGELLDKLNKIKEDINEINERSIPEDVAKTELCNILLGSYYLDREKAIELSESGIKDFAGTVSKAKDELDKLEIIQNCSSNIAAQNNKMSHLNELMLKIKETKEYKEQKESEELRPVIKEKSLNARHKLDIIYEGVQTYLKENNVTERSSSLNKDFFKCANDKCGGRLEFLQDFKEGDNLQEYVKNSIIEIEKMISEMDKPITRNLRRKEIEIEDLEKLKSVMQSMEDVDNLRKEELEKFEFDGEAQERQTRFVKMIDNMTLTRDGVVTFPEISYFTLNSNLTEHVEEKINSEIANCRKRNEENKEIINREFSNLDLKQDECPVNSENFEKEIKKRKETIERVSSISYSNIDQVETTKEYEKAKAFDLDTMSDETFKEEIHNRCR